MRPILNTFAGEMSHMSDDLQDYWSTRAGITLFAVIALLIGWDVITDYREGANFGHMAIELCKKSRWSQSLGFLIIFYQFYQVNCQEIERQKPLGKSKIKIEILNH